MARRATKPVSSSHGPERDPSKHSLDHFERFAFTLQLPDDGGPFRLEEWQLDILGDYFAGALENLWLWPTGVGKSTLLGALALHHGTYVRKNPNVFILGGLGKHGRNTLDAASKFIDGSVDLKRWWDPQEYGLGRIKSLIDPKGMIQVASAGRRAGGRGGSTVEGSEPTLMLVEELHRHEDDGSAVRTLTTKIQKRSQNGPQVQIVHATTAGDSMESALGRLVKRATDVELSGAVIELDRRPGEYYRKATADDGDLVMHEFALPDEIQPPPKGCSKRELDKYLREVKKANPASFVTVQSLRRIYRATSSEPWVFQRQNCNQWVTADFSAIDKVGWYAGRVDGLKIPAGATGVKVGLDTGTKWATTALTPVWVDPRTGRPRCCGAVILKSEAPGTRRRMRNVIDQLETMRARWPTMEIVFDRSVGGGLIGEQFEEDYGLSVVDFAQAGVGFDLASMLFGEIVDQHGLDHDGNPDVTEQVLAAVVRLSRYGRRWRLEQPRDGRYIDAADAIAMALFAAMNPEEGDEPPTDLADYRIGFV